MAIITVKNRAISLDAAEIPNLDASKITTGTFDASKIGSGTFADARIAASNVSQHATSFDDNKIVNDISTLGLRVHTQENLIASNTNSASFDTFQDSSAISNLVTCQRNASEYMSSVQEATAYGLQMGTYNSQMQILNGGWTGSVANDMLNANGASYIGGYIDRLFDLSKDWKVKIFYTDGSGSKTTRNYGVFTALVTQDTSVAVGNNPTIFNDSTTTNYPHPNLSPTHCSNWLTSSYYSTLGVSGITDNYANGLSGGSRVTVNASGSTSHGRGYVGNYARYGWLAEYDRSAQTITISAQASSTGFDTSDHTNTRGGVLFTNVPSTGRFMFAGGHDESASGKVSGTFNSSDNTKFGSYTSLVSNATGSFTGNNITASSSTNKMGAVITYQDNTGTNALNTDIVLQLSADGGSNYSTATLTALPDFATGIKMAKVNDLSVTAGTSLKYKISFANQASGSKEARIRGVSLQY